MGQLKVLVDIKVHDKYTKVFFKDLKTNVLNNLMFVDFSYM